MSTDSEDPLADVPSERFPKHIAAIMDGNGRWAKQRGLPRRRGHEEGVKSVRVVTEECQRLGIEQLTLYAFSTENWQRPDAEVRFLMALLERYLARERPTILKNNIRFRVIGRLDALPSKVQAEIAETTEASAANTGATLCLAINYGSRQEMADAAKALARDVLEGRVLPDDIDEHVFGRYLYTSGMSDPDLLIRTANEMRLSNYLLWQISYSELYVTPVYWPEFREPQFREAIAAYARRDRRFGGLSEADSVNGKGVA